jgi:hypothetical protein
MEWCPRYRLHERQIRVPKRSPAQVCNFEQTRRRRGCFNHCLELQKWEP